MRTKKPVIFIVGAPRSGVGLLARCLEMLVPPTGGRPGPVDTDILNGRLLRDLAVDPLGDEALPPGWLESAAAAGAAEQIDRLLGSEPSLLTGSLLGPVLPLWMARLRNRGLGYGCLHIIRAPRQAALSLSSRWGMNPLDAARVWLARILQVGSHCPRQVLLTLHDLRADPVASLRGALAALDLGQGIPSSRYAALLRFIEPCGNELPARAISTVHGPLFDDLELLYRRIVGTAKGAMADRCQAPRAGKEMEQAPGLLDALRRQKDHPKDRGRALATISLPAGPGRYDRQERVLRSSRWQECRLTLSRPDLLSAMPLRLAPLDRPGILSLEAALVDGGTGETVRLFRPAHFRDALRGPAMPVPGEATLSVSVTGEDAEILFPLLDAPSPGPLVLRLWLRASTRWQDVEAILRPLAAIESWRAILERDGGDADAGAYRDLAASFARVGAADLAEEVLRRAVLRERFDGELLEEYAQIAMDRQDWSEAVRRWQLLIDRLGAHTPRRVYHRLHKAYAALDSFPRGSEEEEARRGQMDYLDFLAFLHRELRPERYLEIGVQSGRSFFLAPGRALGVDPMPRVDRPLPDGARIFPVTSDDFFRDPPPELREAPPQLVFIDGMHLFEYALRDFINVERHCLPETLVVMDDIFPNHPRQAARERVTRVWAGDVWKIPVILGEYRPDLFLLPLDTEPTGLLLVAGLDPESRVLSDNYEDILSRYRPVAQPPPFILERRQVLPPDAPLLRELLKVLRRRQLGGVETVPGEFREHLQALFRQFPPP